MSHEANDAILEQFAEDYDKWIDCAELLYNTVRLNEPLFHDFTKTIAWQVIRSIAESPDTMHQAKIDLYPMHYEEPDDPGDAIDQAMDNQLDNDITKAGH